MPGGLSETRDPLLRHYPTITLTISMKTLLLAVALCSSAFSQSLDDLSRSRVHLPNGWALTVVGNSVALGDLPLNLAVSPDGKRLAVTNNGQSGHSLQLIDLGAKKVLDSLPVNAAWYGLAWGHDGQTLYASGGNDNWILQLDIQKGKLVVRDSIRLGAPWPNKISIAGLALDEENGVLFAVTKENNSLYVVDLQKKTIRGQYPLGGEGYGCVLSPKDGLLYGSCWGCDKVEVFDSKAMQMVGAIAVGDNPNELLLTRDGSRLFVANANDNTVSVINTRERRVIELLDAGSYPGSLPGSTTNSIALDEQEKTLLVANADNNCLAVFDVSTPGSSKSRGFIPTGWYPTSVRIAGNSILVANGKGLSSKANPHGPNPMRRHENVAHAEGKTFKEQYIAGLFTGSLSIIPMPDDKQLGVFSQAVYANTPYTREKEHRNASPANNPIPSRTGDSSPIKHVFYIIKENRTYDQVLGDIPEGNGDTSLVLFGRNVTPNQHALAKEFVLLDNFYVNGEVSADGHNWSTGAYATDYLEKTWPSQYGGKGGTYDAEGTREIANNKNGFIWDLCKRYGVTYRTYGEFADDYKANIPALEGNLCPYYTSWDQTVMDTTRFFQWKRDFDSLLAINAVPQLSTLRFINDHTEGLRLGRPTPAAAVADNDYAVGLFVEYLSHSRIWNESVVFILEDDAQNGPDHVDAHRSPVYVAGGFVKRGSVDHTPYSTAGVLRTIELILGLPPMSQYDAGAEPLWRCFTEKPDRAPFVGRTPLVDLFATNTGTSGWQRKSEEFDFRKEDRIPDAEFNEVLWYAVRGTPCPPPRRAAFLRVVPAGDDEEE
jgi:YVTN family beta-propeller protein